MPELDRRSYAGKAPTPERHVPLVVVGAGAAGVAAAVEAARAGVEVLLLDEHPVDNDMMAMDVPLCFGQRMDATVRNRAAMLERVVQTNPGLAAADEAGVDVQLGAYVWGAFVNGPTVQELPSSMLGVADDRRSWLVGWDRLIVASGARDVLLGFPGWERAGTLGAAGAAALLTRYRALAARRIVVIGSGALGLHTAALALDHGVEVAGIVEVDERVRGDAAAAKALAARGVPFFTGHTIRAGRGRTGEIESLVLVALDGAGQPLAERETHIPCDAVVMAIGQTPSVELLHLVGARLKFAAALGGWVPELDDSLRTSVPTVFAAGDCAGVHDGMLAAPEIAREQGRVAGIAAAESLGRVNAARSGAGAESRGPVNEARHGSAGARRADGGVRGAMSGLPDQTIHWQQWLASLIAAGGWEVNVCQCEEVTRRELVETRPPRYLKWDSPQMKSRSLDTLLREGPVNQDQIKRLTRAGMGPCQSRRCREQVGLLLAQAAGTTLDRIPLPTFRPPIRPLPLNVLWPDDEPAAMREHWVSWFGIPTQFSPHWEPGMVLDEPTAHARLIVSDE
jgi:thioredoxin reductase